MGHPLSMVKGKTLGKQNPSLQNLCGCREGIYFSPPLALTKLLNVVWGLEASWVPGEVWKCPLPALKVLLWAKILLPKGLPLLRAKGKPIRTRIPGEAWRGGTKRLLSLLMWLWRGVDWGSGFFISPPPPPLHSGTQVVPEQCRGTLSLEWNWTRGRHHTQIWFWDWEFRDLQASLGKTIVDMFRINLS